MVQSEPRAFPLPELGLPYFNALIADQLAALALLSLFASTIIGVDTTSRVLSNINLHQIIDNVLSVDKFVEADWPRHRLNVLQVQSSVPDDFEEGQSDHGWPTLNLINPDLLLF